MEFESDIDRLAALQEVDRKIKEKDDLALVLRREIDERTACLDAQRNEVMRLMAEHEALEAQRIELEARLESESDRIKGSRMRMRRARNERELLAITHEINVAKQGNQQIEEQLLAVMESLEALAGRLATAREELSAMESSAQEEIRIRESRVAELYREVEMVRADREAIVRGLDGSLRSKYEMIFARRGGIAVVEVRMGTCQGCRVSVPPQLFNELRRFRDVRQCPNCHRILYWKPGMDEQPQAS